MQSKATTVRQYLESLPPDRQRALAAVRAVIRKNLDQGFEEGMQYGMIGYYVPHRIYPAGYHCNPAQPVPFACLASQKNYMSLYLMHAYGDSVEEKWLREQWAQTGKKLDMGKCCIRFKRLDDLALDVIGAAIRRVKISEYVERYRSVVEAMGPRQAKSKAKSPAKKAATPAGRSRRSATKNSTTKNSVSSKKSTPARSRAGKKGRSATDHD